MYNVQLGTGDAIVGATGTVARGCHEWHPYMEFRFIRGR